MFGFHKEEKGCKYDNLRDLALGRISRTQKCQNDNFL